MAEAKPGNPGSPEGKRRTAVLRRKRGRRGPKFQEEWLIKAKNEAEIFTCGEGPLGYFCVPGNDIC